MTEHADRVHHRVMVQAPAKGYSVEIDLDARIAFIRVWGQWEEVDGRNYVEYFKTKINAFHGKQWYVVADIAEFPPQNEAVNVQIGRTMEIAVKTGMVRAANVVSSAMTQLQIKRLSEETGLPLFAFFKDRAAAVAWIESSRQES